MRMWLAGDSRAVRVNYLFSVLPVYFSLSFSHARSLKRAPTVGDTLGFSHARPLKRAPTVGDTLGISNT
jgi:hypothetical protein